MVGRKEPAVAAEKDLRLHRRVPRESVGVCGGQDEIPPTESSSRGRCESTSSNVPGSGPPWRRERSGEEHVTDRCERRIIQRLPGASRTHKVVVELGLSDRRLAVRRQRIVLSYSRLQLAPVMKVLSAIVSGPAPMRACLGVGLRFAADAEQRRRCRLHVALLAQIQQPVLIGDWSARRAVMSKSPSAIGAAKLTVRATGRRCGRGGSRCIFNSAAGGDPAERTHHVGPLGWVCPRMVSGAIGSSCTAWSNGA